MSNRRERVLTARRAQTAPSPDNPDKPRLCADGCGKTVTGKQVFASAACRKAWQRSRDKTPTPAAEIPAAEKPTTPEPAAATVMDAPEVKKK